MLQKSDSGSHLIDIGGSLRVGIPAFFAIMGAVISAAVWVGSYITTTATVSDVSEAAEELRKESAETRATVERRMDEFEAKGKDRDASIADLRKEVQSIKNESAAMNGKLDVLLRDRAQSASPTARRRLQREAEAAGVEF